MRTMRGVVLTLVVLLAASGCALGGSAATPAFPPLAATTPDAASHGCRSIDPQVRVQVSAPDMARVTTLMHTLATHAWNPAAPPVRPSTLTGGLWINWKATWDGATAVADNTDIRTDGSSDATANVAMRHDPLVDLQVLRDIDVWEAAGGSDPLVTALRCQLQPVVAAEFVAYGVDRGWVYTALIDLSRLDKSGPWKASARRFADRLSRTYVDATTGGIVDGPGRTYRSDYAAESAAALVDAGARFKVPSWTRQGNKAAAYLVAHGADGQTGLFPSELRMGQGAKDVVVDPLVKEGAQAQLVDALLSVWDGDHDKQVKAAAAKALTSLRSRSLGLFDAGHGGWFYAVDSDGTQVRTAYKETRSAWSLPLLRHAIRAHLLPAGSTKAFTAIVRNALWRDNGMGYVYRVAPDFSAYQSHNGGRTFAEDWISSEACGIAAAAMLGALP